MTEGYLRKMTTGRDKTKTHRVEQGAQLQKWAVVKIPAELLDKNTEIRPGDMLLPGKGIAQLASPSQPKKEGWSYFVVEEVQDRRREAVLPHLLLRCT